MVNIEYIKTAFSADCSKIFDGKNMGKIGPIYVPYFGQILPIKTIMVKLTKNFKKN